MATQPGAVKQKILHYETPKIRERNILSEDSICDFSGFGEETTEAKRLVEVERQMRCLNSLVEDLLERQTQFKKDNEELKRRY